MSSNAIGSQLMNAGMCKLVTNYEGERQREYNSSLQAQKSSTVLFWRKSEAKPAGVKYRCINKVALQGRKFPATIIHVRDNRDQQIWRAVLLSFFDKHLDRIVMCGCSMRDTSHSILARDGKSVAFRRHRGRRTTCSAERVGIQRRCEFEKVEKAKSAS